MTKRKKVLSLFTGCGGMDLGFRGGFSCFRRQINEKQHADWIDKVNDDDSVNLKRTSFDITFANDILPYAKTMYERYFHGVLCDDTHYELTSVVELVKKEKNGEFSFPDADVVTGGFPCQSFSVAGKRRGFNDLKSDKNEIIEEPTPENRGMLYYWMREVIGLVNPKMFVAENVKGLVSLGDAKDVIEHDFSTIGNGYVVVPARVMHVANYGVAQNRERVIFFGFNKQFLTKAAAHQLQQEIIDAVYDPYPSPTHQYNVTDDSDNLYSYFTAAEALFGLPEPSDSDDESQQCFSGCKFLSKGQGQSEVKLDGIAPTIRAQHHGNIEFRRLSAEHGGKHIEELQQNLPERRLTVRECARIQSFPDDYEFVHKKRAKDDVSVSGTQGYVVIGNAVPPLFAYNIAKNIEDKWETWFGDK